MTLNISLQAVASKSNAATPVVLKPLIASNNDTSKHNVHYARPDIQQMVSFKPSTAHGMIVALFYLFTFLLVLGVGMNAIPGGHFPLPSSVAQLMSLLPPPQSYQV